jgi:hypothetical protein
VDTFALLAEQAEQLNRLITGGCDHCGSRVSNSATSPGPIVMSWSAKISRSRPDNT